MEIKRNWRPLLWKNGECDGVKEEQAGNHKTGVSEKISGMPDFLVNNGLGVIELYILCMYSLIEFMDEMCEKGVK